MVDTFLSNKNNVKQKLVCYQVLDRSYFKAFKTLYYAINAYSQKNSQ